jgi:hypothetical protein
MTGFLLHRKDHPLICPNKGNDNMSTVGGGPQGPDWLKPITELEFEIDHLKVDSSHHKTLGVRNRVAQVSRYVERTIHDLSQKSGDLSQLSARLTEIQTHLSILEEKCENKELWGIFAGNTFRVSRIFGSLTRNTLKNTCFQLQQTLQETFCNVAIKGIENLVEQEKIKQEIRKITKPIYREIIFACIKNECFNGGEEERIELIRQINATHPSGKINFDLATNLISKIPLLERTPQNIALFINATVGLPQDDCSNFCSYLEAIPEENRVYMLQSCIDYKDQLNLLLNLKFMCSGLYLAAPVENKIEVFNKLLQQPGAREKINVIRDIYGRTALLNICTRLNNQNYNDSLERIEILIKNGADTTIRDCLGFSAYAYFKAMGLDVPKCLNVKPDEVGFRLKMAALIWGINEKESLEEGQPEFSLQGGTISVPLSKEISESKFLPELVKKAFSEVTAARTVTEMSHSIREGKLTIIPSGYIGHAMSFVFYQDLLFVCNRGEGSEDGSLSCFRIDPAKVSAGEITKLLEMKDRKKEVALEYFYELLPKGLGNEAKLENITSIFSSLEPKKQTVGNCSAASTKLAIRMALAAIAYKKNGDTFSDDVALEVHDISKQVTQELREKSFGFLKAELERVDHPAKERVLAHFMNKKRSPLGQ